MPRPPGDADKRMLAVGKEIARMQGCAALRIREVVERAGVNLGMFHYHFRSRRKFTRLVLEEIYGEFFRELTGIANAGADPLTQLRDSLVLLGDFMGRNRSIVISLLKDVLNGEPEVVRYGRRNLPPPHAEVIRKLYFRCQKEGRLGPLPLAQAVPLFLGALSHPLLFSEVAGRLGTGIEWLDTAHAMSCEAIRERMEVILRGMGAKT